MGYFKGRRGFTLIEMVIAVALLAAAGTVAVRLFVQAHVNNQLAADIDQSVFCGSAWIETIKSSPENWIGGDSSAPDSTVTTIEPCSYVIFYDNDWIVLDDGQDRMQKAGYAMHIDLFRMPGSQGLWTIELRTFKLGPYPLHQDPYEEILMLSAMVNVPGEVMEP